MLAGKLSVKDCLRPIDVEYPSFSRHMCHLLRDSLRAHSLGPLIYSKLIAKEEIADDSEPLFHLLDELSCIQMTSRLFLDDCRHLCEGIRDAKTDDAHQMVSDYLSGRYKGEGEHKP